MRIVLIAIFAGAFFDVGVASAIPVNGAPIRHAAATMDTTELARTCGRGSYLASNDQCYRAYRTGCARGYVRNWIEEPMAYGKPASAVGLDAGITDTPHFRPTGSSAARPLAYARRRDG